MKKSIALMILGGSLLLIGGYAALDQLPSPAAHPTAREQVARGAFLLDVRTPEEFAEGHLPGATNVSVQTLAGRLDEVPKDRPIVLYCRSGKRSARAAEILRNAGHEEVFDLGAMSNW